MASAEATMVCSVAAYPTVSALALGAAAPATANEARAAAEYKLIFVLCVTALGSFVLMITP